MVFRRTSKSGCLTVMVCRIRSYLGDSTFEGAASCYDLCSTFVMFRDCCLSGFCGPITVELNTFGETLTFSRISRNLPGVLKSWVIISGGLSW